MRWLSAGLLSALLLGAEGRSPQHVNKKVPASKRDRLSAPRALNHKSVDRRAGETIIPQTVNTTKYAVNGTAIPDVNFDIGESYAGLMPIGATNASSELYFWFFPSSNPDASDEITIWLNGGPGCSSLEGLLQENGIFQWQYGTFAPVQNNYAWSNLTNMVWVEQPAGTGFSKLKGKKPKNEDDVAEQFLGFFKNFMDTFGLQNRKVYITGESYAGYYVPYIASAMLDKNDTTYYDVKGIQINDPTVTYDTLQEEVPALDFVLNNQNLFNLNDSFISNITAQAQSCGYTDYMSKYLVYPPSGLQPGPDDLPGGVYGIDPPECDIWTSIFNAALEVNPCFDEYQIATTCPLLWDVLGFPGSIPYEPDGAFIYFNRTDVQDAINAPHIEWEECTNGVLDNDNSPPTGVSVLPGVIERTQNVLIAHALLDYILIANGTLLMIQNMTWGGQLGFQSEPAAPFYVPYHSEGAEGSIAGAGIMGTTHTERGLTFVSTILSGHMIPQYQPSAAYRQLEFLLGRISSLSEVSDFTTQSGDFGNDVSNSTKRHSEL